MRLVMFDDDRIGVLSAEGVHDVTRVLPEALRGTPGSMNALIERWEGLRPAVERLAGETEPRPPAAVRLLPPVRRPTQILAAPTNYRLHMQEMRGTPMGVRTTTGRVTPRDIGFFLKAPGSLAGPADAIELPPFPGRRFDHESELALVIGREARAVKGSRAYDHIFGYTCLVDVSMRMTEERREERTMRKSFATFTPIGPALVTADEVPHPDRLQVRLWVSDELRQDANTRDLIVGIPELMEIASAVLPLQPGDIYATGTPAGVGPIADGDVVTIEIEQVGRMSLPVRTRAW
jgi:2-keto-4-pentenoate hydratase/2-oxohepta-3-ene-1,7-dioic acid hydratase in catechol pathway